MEDSCRIGDPSFFQTKVDMTHVDSPSSTMHRCTTKFWMDTRIWKPIVEGMCGSPFSVSNVISLESEGLLPLKWLIGLSAMLGTF